MSKDPSEFVSTFLDSVGKRQDVELYLRIFRELPKESFAVITGEPALLRRAAGTLAEALRFLADLDLYPVIALGLFGEGGPAPSAMLKKLAEADVRCERVPLDAELVENTRAQLRQTVAVLLDLREQPLAERSTTLGQLMLELGTRKLVVLRARGGLGPHVPGALHLTQSHALLTTDTGISVVNLTTDLADLKTKSLARGEQDLISAIAALHARFPQLLTSITSPFHLIQELFTVKGAGTLVKTGSIIQRYSDYADLDREHLVQLMNDTFGKPLSPAFLQRSPLAVYVATRSSPAAHPKNTETDPAESHRVEHDYRGTAIVHAGRHAAFLTKFAVSRVAQGEGVGRDLWEALTRDYPALYWRARADNPIAEWYAKLCDGMQQSGGWRVYWRGVAFQHIPDVIEDACSREVDFLDTTGSLSE